MYSRPRLPSLVGLSVGRVLAAVLLLGGVWGSGSSIAQDSSHGARRTTISVDDFESYEPGTFPEEWVFVASENEVRTYEETKAPGRKVVVREEGSNRFVRLITRDNYLRYTQRNGVDFNWTLDTHPRLAWRWRALELPEGASEKGKNDTGAALYVTFGADWLGRPKSIKYTYSSSLPVGTVASFGPLKVIVVDSATEGPLGEWQHVQRNVVEDYRQVFGGRPPNRPKSITIWSDSDTTGDEAKVDLDDIELVPPRHSSSGRNE